MAGLGRKVWSAGDVLAAADVMGYLMDQSVMYFASGSARSAALGTAVSAGMLSYRADGTAVEVYNGTTWTQITGGGGGGETISSFLLMGA